MYVSLYDFICLGLLIPFVLGFCLFIWLLFVCFLFMSECVKVSFCYFVCLVLLLPFGLGFYLSFFFLLLLLSLSHAAGRVLVLWPRVRPEPPRWEIQIQDIGPPEASQPHII